MVPDDDNIVNFMFVCFEGACCLCFVLARIALVPHDVNIVNLLFVRFEVACVLCFVLAPGHVAAPNDGASASLYQTNSNSPISYRGGEGTF